MITREMRLVGLEHEDFFVRSALLSIFKDDADRDIAATRAVMAMIDRYGWLESFEWAGQITDLPIDEGAADWALKRIESRRFDGENDRASMGLFRWVARAPVPVVAERLPRLVELAGLNLSEGRNAEMVEAEITHARRRVGMAAMSEAQGLARLEEICEECGAAEEFPHELVEEANDLGERLTIAGESAAVRDRALAWIALRPGTPGGDWRIIFGVILAGRLRLRETASFLIELLDLDWEYLNECIEKALTRMGDPDVVREIISQFADLEFHARLFLSGVLGSVRIPELEEAVRELTEEEEDPMLRGLLGAVIAAYGNPRGLEVARGILSESPEDRDYFQIAETCYAFDRLLGRSADAPELAEWRIEMEKNLERARNPDLSFEKRPGRLGDMLAAFEGDEDDDFPMPAEAPPKIGRNDPCPCGSGKKYKKCCVGR